MAKSLVNGVDSCNRDAFRYLPEGKNSALTASVLNQMCVVARQRSEEDDGPIAKQ